MATVLLFVFMLMFMLMRVYMPIGVRVTGKEQKSVLLSFPEKAVMQRTNMYSLGAVILLMAVTGVLPGYAEIFIVAFAMAIMAMPVRAIFTSDGVALNRVVFRPWSDFSAFRVENKRIVLVGKPGNRPLNLSLFGTHQQEVIPLLRRRLSEAKAEGKAGARRRAIAG